MISSSPGDKTTGPGLGNDQHLPDDPLAYVGVDDRRMTPDATAFALSCCGRFRSLNQDRILLDHDDRTGVRTLAVFDGHGVLGENAALMARAVLASRTPAPLLDTLAAVQDLLLEVADNEHRRDAQWAYDYGTTAAVARVGSDAIVDVAWIGDSRIAIFEENARTRTWSWLWSSSDHNPRTNEAEAERLARAEVTTVDRGGVRIYPGPIMPIDDAVRQKLTLNMSRALGHRVLGRYGVLGQAEAVSRRLSRVRATCIVCGSDGIWDVLDERDVAAILTETLSNGVRAAAETIVLRSDQEWIRQCSGDNMSVAISVIRPRA